MSEKREPKIIRTIVVAYTREELPVSVMQVHRRFEHAVAKAGWAIRVRLDAATRVKLEAQALAAPAEPMDLGAASPGAAAARKVRVAAAPIAAVLVASAAVPAASKTTA